MGAPEVASVLAHAPATGASFAGERVLDSFAKSKAAGAKSDRSQAGSGHELVKQVIASFAEDFHGCAGGFVVGGLHEYVGHAFTGPVCFQEDG